MNWLRQTVALTVFALRSVPGRMGSSLVTVVGTTIVVGILIALLSVGEGARFWSARNARSDRAVILSHGAPFPPVSILTRENLTAIADAPGVKQDARGNKMMTAGTMALLDVVTRLNQRSSIFLIGMTRTDVYPEIHIIAGRWYKPGLHEVIVSKAAQKLDRGLDLGNQIPLRGLQWTVVGVFEDSGGVFDQVLFSDGETVMGAFHRSTYEQAVVMLDSPGAYGAFKSALARDPTLRVDVYTEAQNRDNNLGGLRGLLDFVSYFVGGILGAGAISAALSSLYAAVDARQREIGTLRAMGFAAVPVLVSILAESLLLALGAALVGAVIAWLLFNGKIVNTEDFIFPLAVSERVVVTSILWALAIGFVGGLFPAIRAARLSVADSMRAL